MTAEPYLTLLRVEDVAKMLSVSRTTVYHMAQAGEIPSIKIGASLRFDREDVAEYIRAQRRVKK